MRAQPSPRVAAADRAWWEQGKKRCSYGRFLVLNVTDSRRWRSGAIGLLQGRPALHRADHVRALGQLHLLFFYVRPENRLDAQQSKMSLQIAEFASNRQWKSVVVTGRYQELPATQGCHHERIHAWSLREKKPNWWKPGGHKPVAKPSAHIFVCVVMDEIAGRAASAAVAGVLRAELASRPQRARVTGPAKGPGCRVSDVAVTPVSEARAATLPLS
ncbi:pyridoxamine 5'-phosphate oxidase family protein (plasmid) [Sinorhizobium meliloti]|uniref:Uncharacterized protein n=1 Tax=Rhizobium meliloti (strain 1021) TaxID=266834 RepID=Q92ZP1_RHIME|nr:hypothetical protein SMa0763 [Sinorhizobium meliloti 1021]AGG70096.1 Hypothetical protein SM2011_a0763 [Sinorhizobium meliloti 2011]ASP60506.1 pyridoxamine 5'-phosphate oxidase family protein [Sinorhizobium meliloti]MQW46812.1 pyridoxamine 5'-phosphate oxidase family protein [Sinorhizobium meliloti]RVG84186.1 pyridoxamine 5'-phosphate oxidase family protein [Sinorhizobium meliloti]